MNRYVETRMKSGLTQRQVAERLGVATTTVSQYEADRRIPRPEIRERYAELFNVPISYFEHAEVALVPRFTAASAGPGCWADGVPEEYLLLPERLRNKGEFFAVYAKGDSMLPRIENGDLIYARKQNFLDHNGQMAIITIDNEARVKKVSLTEKGLMVESLNPEYPPELHRGDVFINGVVKLIVREVED